MILCYQQQLEPLIQRAADSCICTLDDNPLGNIVTNSDLELPGAMTHASILADTTNMHEYTLTVFSNNTLAVAWTAKASTPNSSPAAGLLQTASLH